MRIGSQSTVEGLGRSGIMARFQRDDSLLRKKILSFLPFMFLTNLARLLLVSVDGLVVGNLVGSSALASVSVFVPITNAFGIFSMLVSSGISTTISTGMGAANLDELASRKRAARLLTILTALAIGILQFPIASVMIRAYGLSPELQDMVWRYGIGVMLSMPFGLVSTICVYELQVLGRTKILSVLAVVEGCLNLALDLLFVGVFKMGVAGAGYGTAVATTIRCVISVVYLYRKSDIYQCGNAKLRAQDVGQILRTGSSEAIYGVISAVQSFLMMKIILSVFGEGGGVMKAVCLFCFSLASLAISSVQASTRPLIGIVTGGKDTEGIRLLIRRSIFLSSSILGALTLVMLAAPGLFYRLHGVADIPEYGFLALRLYALQFVFCGINCILRMYFANRGDIAYSTVAAIIGYASPLLFTYLMSLIYTPLFWLGHLISESVLLLTNFLHYRACLKEDAQAMQPGEEYLYLTVHPEDAIEASHSIRRFAEEHGYSERVAYRAALCMEEMIHYAEAVNGTDRVDAQVMVKFYDGGCVFSIMDDGRCIMLNEDDASKDLVSNYNLIKKIATSVSYQYVLEMNYTVFTFVDKPSQGAPAAAS